jgi:hypothetical protein
MNTWIHFLLQKFLQKIMEIFMKNYKKILCGNIT